MPLSRLRLRLAGWFALAFLAGLLLLSITLFLYAHHQSDRRFTEELATQARELAAAVRVEQSETPMAGLEAAVGEALDELPSRSEAFGVYATDGRRMGTGGPPSLRKWLPDSLPPSDLRPKEFRKKRPYVRMVPVNEPDPDFRIAAVGTDSPARCGNGRLRVLARGERALHDPGESGRGISPVSASTHSGESPRARHRPDRARRARPPASGESAAR